MSTDGSNLITDITPLALSDNFYTWFTRTNLLIDAINPLNIYDITPRKGLTESRSGGNVIIDVDTGKGLKAYPNDATGKLTLDFESLTSAASVANDDLFVIETPTTGVSNDVYKISASAMLPPTLTGNHAFTGTITASVLNVNDNAIRLQYGDTVTENDAGLILDTTTSSKVKFTYDLARAAWFSNRNIGLQTGYSFLTNSNNRRGDFKFSTHGSNQYDVGLELLMGQQSTQGDDHSWLIEARNVDRALNFIYKTYVNTDVENRIFYAQIDTLSPVTSTFVISDKIQIGNVSGSTTNFKSVTDYSSSIIPISNSNGILDSKWTNRYVSSTYSSSLVVGDIVKIYNDTNNQATVVKCALTSGSDDSEAYSLGIVERISGGKVWVVTHGEFSNVTGLDPGAVYYLTDGTPNYTLTKPTTGIVKPVFVATSSTTGVIFPMSAQGLSFGRFNAVATSGGTLVSGSTVTSDAPNDIFTLDAGSGISLETDTSNNKIIIRASTVGNQPTYSTIIPNSGDNISAITPGETLTIQGVGGIEVIGDNNTVGDILNIRGKYFRTISWSGDSTNDIASSKTATNYDDTLSVFAGAGISISSYGSGFRIDATGTSVPSISTNSVSLDKLVYQNKNSILYTSSSPNPGAVTALQTTNNTLLSADSSGAISWATPLTILQEKFAKSGFETGYPSTKQNNFGITSTRNFGIIRIPRNATTIETTQDYEIPAFRFTTTNSINGALIGLQEGDGIELAVNNTVADIISGIPSIKITNKYGSAFSKVYIADTGETIESNGTLGVTYSNYFLNSNVMTSITWLRYRDAQTADSSTGSATSNIPGKEVETSITFTDGVITSTTGTKVTFVNNPSLTSNLNNGIYANLYKPGTTTSWNATETEGKYLTISVYVATLSGTQSFKIGYYHGRKAGFANRAVTYSPDFTATTSPQRFTFTVKAEPSTVVQASTSEIPPNINISQPFGTITGGSVVVWGAQVEEGRTANPLISTTTTALSVIRTETQSHGTLNFSTISSPILLDSDTNSDTIYFNIATNSITNSYLATMADNTVKVGTGSTNANNTPQDLAIVANSVLGRVGNGDLKSVSASELATMIGANYFTSVETDSGTVYPAETNAIKLKGGSGITITESTNHEIIITNTGGTGGTGSLSLIGDWNGSSSDNSVTSKEKLYFGDSDLQYTVSSLSGDSLAALVTSTINWGGLTTQSSAGAGFLYGKGSGSSSNTDKASITTSFEPIGNGAYSAGTSKSFIPVIDGSTDTLSYVKRAASQTDTIDRVLGFKSDGTLVSTDKFVNTITFANISNLTFSVSSGAGTLTASTTAPVTFPFIQSSNGVYFGPSSSLGLAMTDGGSDGKSDFTLATSDNLSSTWNSSSYVTSMYLGGYSLSGSSYSTPTSTQIKTRYFGSSAWANLSTTDSPRICMPDFLIGTGPSANTATTGSGVYLRNDTTNNGLIFTNYNLSANASRSTEKDRSCRLGLEVLDVDTGSTAYASSKNTAYITHTYVPASLSTTTVDSFTVSGSTKKSYKYLVHAQNVGGDFYTTELLIQIKGTTTNILQYASSTTSSSLTVSFSVAVVGTTATVSHNNTAGSLDIKLIKYEI